MAGRLARSHDHLHTSIFPVQKIGRSSVGLSVGCFNAGTACYVAQIIGSIFLISGYVAGLYVASVAMVLSFAFFISGAWLLITGIYDNQVQSTVNDPRLW